MSDYKTKNLEHFDKRAAQYDSASKEELARRIADAFIAAEGVKWDANSTTVVDFACGTGTLPHWRQLLMTGLISNKLLPHVKKVVGVDISQGMVNVFDQKIAQSNSKDKMQAVCIDIMSIPYSEIPEELKGVDVVVCSMAYHHIDNVDHATTVLASLLKKGGHLLVIDLFAGCLF
jgi:ubiquinone/menaquinone biosynthesis C-methylase UbiE